MTKSEDFPVFPFEPTSIEKSRFRVSIQGDFKSEEDIQHLIYALWNEPECPTYYYFEKDGAIDNALSGRNDILTNKMQRRYFAHPKYERDFICIPDRNGEYEWDWEREVVKRGPEYWQVELTLSSKKVAELDAWRKIQLEEIFREQRRSEKYQYDVFLSYAHTDRDEAELIHKKVVAAGGKIFMAPKVLIPGDDFAEEIRAALAGAEKLWLLVSPESVKSEWVISEWGAAWILQKNIVPILHRCAPDSLPDRLKKYQATDLHKVDGLVVQIFSTPST